MIMRVDFIVESEIHPVEEIAQVVGRKPDKVKRIGEFVNPAKLKKWEYNRCVYRLTEDNQIERLEGEMLRLMDTLDQAFLEINAYRYFDLVIEKNSLNGDFRLANSTIEKMRKLDIQIEIDITKY